MKELKERNQAIRKKRKEGLTYSAIGKLFGNISRQRAQQIAPKKQPGTWRLLWGIFKKLIN